MCNPSRDPTYLVAEPCARLLWSRSYTKLAEGLNGLIEDPKILVFIEKQKKIGIRIVYKFFFLKLFIQYLSTIIYVQYSRFVIKFKHLVTLTIKFNAAMSLNLTGQPNVLYLRYKTFLYSTWLHLAVCSDSVIEFSRNHSPFLYCLILSSRYPHIIFSSPVFSQ